MIVLKSLQVINHTLKLKLLFKNCVQHFGMQKKYNSETTLVKIRILRVKVRQLTNLFIIINVTMCLNAMVYNCFYKNKLERFTIRLVYAFIYMDQIIQ